MRLYMHKSLSIFGHKYMIIHRRQKATPQGVVSSEKGNGIGAQLGGSQCAFVVLDSFIA